MIVLSSHEAIRGQCSFLDFLLSLPRLHKLLSPADMLADLLDRRSAIYRSAT